MDYREAGVDRELADQFVEGLKEKVRKTYRPEILGELGDFGGFFQAPRHMKDPIFVASTDGVGTKLALAESWGGKAHKAVGQDVVAMCVNDLVACRAEPLLFLDYLATGKLEPQLLNLLLEGIVDACAESGCTLAGGETAEMPGYYPSGRYDVAGFSVGVLERADRLSANSVMPGDIVVGMKSSGFHSNGFSLVRKVLEKQNWKLDEVKDGICLGDYLLEPTKLYVKPVLKLFSQLNVKAASHITGGGLIENLPRGVNESKVKIVLERKSLLVPALMQRFVEAAALEEREAFSTWNMGTGFCLIVDKADETKLSTFGDLIRLGHIEERMNSKDSVVLI